MGIRSDLDRVSPTINHLHRSVEMCQDAMSHLRAAKTSVDDARHHLTAFIKFADADDPNRSAIEALLVALR